MAPAAALLMVRIRGNWNQIDPVRINAIRIDAIQIKPVRVVSILFGCVLVAIVRSDRGHGGTHMA